MYTDETPPSFSSAGPIGINIPDQIQYTTSDVHNQPPSYDAMGHDHQLDSYTKYQTSVTYRALDQTTTLPLDNAPSFTALQDQGHGHSYTTIQDHSDVNREVGGDRPVSIGAMGKGEVSNVSGDVGGYDIGGKGPGLSDVNRREASQAGGASGGVVVDDVDVKELVGISLVGKNFRRLYPNAYYKEKDEEEEEDI
ncbi:hypothetical protein QVD17_09465 [Tagetes erecta]|uniref:Uncharacterized protein n=1 Tax=Tagetes erecta TaxID=13708 RepID=A0AAD8L102_TARER|nr:hypothetical protein QVD17_09465 [Tagetes erecta]